MKTTNLLKTALVISLASFLFVGCSSDDDNDSVWTGDTSTAVVEGVIVDPYIEGAVLCEDVNLDGECTGLEQNSSASTVDGVFGFDNNLTAGAHIMVKTQGMHEGKEYDLNISGLVADDGSIDVVSPLTTFETKGLTTTEIANILTTAAEEAGVSGWSISSSDVNSNPMDAGLADKTISTLTDEDLVNIQASLASYGILKIMSGSDALSALTPTELLVSGTSGELHEIAKVMVGNIAATLNKALLTTIKSGIDSGRTTMVTMTTMSGGSMSQATADAALPEPTTTLVIKVAVSIIDRLAGIGYTTCNATDGNVTAALTAVSDNSTAVAAKAEELGTQLYGLTYHDAMDSELSNLYGGVVLNGMFSAVPNIETGYDAEEAGHTTIRFDSSNNLVAE